MDIEDRKRDIYAQEQLGLILGELELLGTSGYLNAFKSIEFYQIIHVTDEERYYIDEESESNLCNSCDVCLDTEKGTVYCFR